jgi:hypothetical protein
MLARKNPHLLRVVGRRWGIRGMYRFPSGDAKKWLVACIALALLALVVVWLGLPKSSPQLARDFEECGEQVEAEATSNDGRGASMTNCSARFAGRRKPGGGYRYYDFMQDRNFDIAGPNPTAEERKQIDREYMGFLDAQRRETISAELIKRQNEQLRADLENVHQSVGPPVVLTPRNPAAAAAKRPADRSKSARCQDVSLTCGWAKFSAVVKNAFASSKTKP